MKPLLELRHVTKIYSRGAFGSGETVALEDISLSLNDQPPSIVALAGESGSGKTTMGLLLLGFLGPTQGEVLYKGTPLSSLSGRQWDAFRKEVQGIFQDPFAVYNPFYKVDHVLSVPIAKFRLAGSRQEAYAMMEQALLGVGLRPEETLGRYPHELSGGQLQRITVARALLLKPQLLIADEPVSMVDASLRATILESLHNLNRDLGISILYITHDLTTAYHICDSIVVLYQGTIVEAGDVDLVIKTPRHPYTQLLVTSIPWPDPDRRWEAEQIPEGQDRGLIEAGTGCKFAERCTWAMPRCWEAPPPLFRVAERRAAACYLYAELPVLSGGELAQVLTGQEKVPPKIQEATSPPAGNSTKGP